MKEYVHGGNMKGEGPKTKNYAKNTATLEVICLTQTTETLYQLQIHF